MRNFLERPVNSRFSQNAANRAIEFINRECCHTDGYWAGAPFNLRPWQEIHIREIFGRVDDEGRRVIRQVYWEVPKKTGKSSLAAAIALKLLFADDEPAAEVYGAAADRDQASIVFNTAVRMVRRNPRLQELSEIIPSTKRIVAPSWDGFYRALSAEVAGKHGFNSHGVIFDEVHAQRTPDLWDVLTFGAGDTRSQPLVFAITTAGIPGESPVAEMLHEDADQILRGLVPCPPDFYPVVYSAPSDAPWDDEEVWRACNPALGDFLRIESVRVACERAKRRPAEQNAFRRLRLNQWVSQETRWLDVADWDACGRAIDPGALKELPCYAGLDLSTTTDITALALKFLGNVIYSLNYFWCPEDNLLEKCKPWAKAGYITVTPGNVIDYDAVRARINEIGREFQILEIAYDPWNATQIVNQLAADGFKMVPIRQGFQSLSAPSKEYERLVLGRGIRHSGNPVMRWMIDCVTVKQDPAGNIKPVKPERLKSNKRIDGVVADIMSLDRATRNEGSSGTVSRGIVVIRAN